MYTSLNKLLGSRVIGLDHVSVEINSTNRTVPENDVVASAPMPDRKWLRHKAQSHMSLPDTAWR